MMKSLPLLFFLSCSLPVIFFTGCNSRSTLSDGRFVVGFDANFPPYGYKEGTEYKGFDLDLARAVCESRGWTFVARPIVWADKDAALNAGDIDCIWNGFTMQGRENDYTWTEPYVDNSQVVLVKKGTGVRTLANLAGKVVGVQSGTSVQKALSGEGERSDLGKRFKKLVAVPHYGDAVRKLDEGGVDAVAMDIGIARRVMKRAPGRYAVLPEIIVKETYGVGFKKGNEALRDLVDETLRDLTDDGTVKILAGKYGIEENALVMWKN